MELNFIITGKIRKYIKLLKRKFGRYTITEAFKLIRKQIKQDEALKEKEMGPVDKDIWIRLKENWPFKNVI